MTMDEKGNLWCSVWGGLYRLKGNRFLKVSSWTDFQNAVLQPNHVDIGWINELLNKGGPQMKNLLRPWLLSGDSLWTNVEGIKPGSSYIDLSIADISTGKIIRKFQYDPASPSSAPRSEGIKLIFQDSRKNIWIGSNSTGLCLYQAAQNKFTHFTEKDGLPNNVVYGILEDDHQNLWLSTNKGLCEFNPITKKVRNFDVYDGLQSNEFNSGAYFKSPSGKMYFGGVNGLNYFHPKDIVTTYSLPQSAITGYYVNNTFLKDYSSYVREDRDNKPIMELQYNERDFGFDVAGIGFSLPGRTRYRYQLENYDKQWHDIGNLRHVSFTNIPAGRYVFRIQSSDSFGNWETEGASLNVLINAPFWTNKWIWFGSGMSLLVLVTLGYYFRLNQLKRETQKLETIVDERTQKIQLQKQQIETQNEELQAQAQYLAEKNVELERAKGLLEIEIKYLHQHQLLKSSIQTQEEERKRIAIDLHDELGAVLSIARMHLVQIQKAEDVVAVQDGLQQARMLTEAALATMRRISHDLMPPQLEDFGLAKTLEAIIAQVREAKKISVSFHASDELPRWSMPVELGLYRICMEMINNTLKHAEATRISITVEQCAGQIAFSYSDNGKGLPEIVNAGHGLKNMEARANIIGGVLEMGNREHGGFYATIKISGAG
jgi:signal transduction histidine kinase